MSTDRKPTWDRSVDAEVGPVEVRIRYLDLDGDGVPDAVQTVELMPVGASDQGIAHVVEVHEEVASDIGIDGAPGRTAVVDTKLVDLAELAAD